MTTRRQSLEQQRADAAWKNVEAVKLEHQSKYGTLVRQLPAMIQMNGLGTTLAFLMAKGKINAASKENKDNGHSLIFKHLSEWVLMQMGLGSKHKTLMDLVRNDEMDIYRQATREAIEYGIWLKRFVEAQDWGSVEGNVEP